MKRFLRYFVFVTALFAIISSCNDDNNLREMEKEEIRLLEEYMQKYYPEASPLPSGLYVIVTEDAGNPYLIEESDTVQIYYTGRFLLTDEVFDSNFDSEGRMLDPLQFVVGTGAVISGMDEGMTYLKAGDKATLIIPSSLGYGATNNGSIPRFSTLIFDVEIYKHFRNITDEE